MSPIMLIGNLAAGEVDSALGLQIYVVHVVHCILCCIRIMTRVEFVPQNFAVIGACSIPQKLGNVSSVFGCVCFAGRKPCIHV
jgi:hypothetical protein